MNAQIQEYTKQYDVECQGKTTCPIQITVEEKMTGPVFFYYALDNFYQNHRRYIKSRSDTQLSGTEQTVNDIKTNCDPIITNADLGFGDIKAVDGTTLLDPSGPATPCGLIAWSVFNGKFQLFFHRQER